MKTQLGLSGAGGCRGDAVGHRGGAQGHEVPEHHVEVEVPPCVADHDAVHVRREIVQRRHHGPGDRHENGRAGRDGREGARHHGESFEAALQEVDGLQEGLCVSVGVGGHQKQSRHL